MARNEEKHYGRLNRLYLLKEKEEYEKANPQRPKLDSLETAEDVQKWLPSIKRDIEFYLNKSKVICYSDAHVDECKEKVVKLEKEFKAYVRKIHQLSPSPIDAIPWTNRPYKRKNIDTIEETSFKQFKLIDTPILDNQTADSLVVKPLDVAVNLALMDAPLSFSFEPAKERPELSSQQSGKQLALTSSVDLELSVCQSLHEGNKEGEHNNICHKKRNSEFKRNVNIVNYDSSDAESS